MEGHREHATRGVKSFFDAVAVMVVQIDVQNACELSTVGESRGRKLEQLQNRQNHVVDIGKAGSFRFLCVVHASRPVDHDIGLVFHESSRTGYGSSRVRVNIVQETGKDGIVLANVIFVVLNSAKIQLSPLTGLSGRAATRR